MLQSLIHGDDVDAVVDQYGQIIVDECHHISARSFELVARAAKAKYVAGFSATVERKDGHHPIIFMQCGPIRHAIPMGKQQSCDSIERRVLVRPTGFVLPGNLADLKSLKIHDIYEALACHSERNEMIAADAIACVNEGRWPLILTERRQHLEELMRRLRPAVPRLIVLAGGMTQRQRLEALGHLRQDGARLVLATGRYLGEGFDDDRLDALLLAMPISWKGTLAQYAGRLHRIRTGKRDVVIYDYADTDVPMLKRMFQRRLAGYKKLGYALP
jgi:superfamily II DNA or RNA helicase